MPANRIAKWDGTPLDRPGSGMDGDSPAFMPWRWTRAATSTPGAGSPRPASRRPKTSPAGPRPRPAISGAGTYTFYTNNLPVTIVVPPDGQGDLARIILQRFDKSHANASPALQTGYYWQIEGLNASGRTASGYSVDLTLSARASPPTEMTRCVITPDQGGGTVR